MSKSRKLATVGITFVLFTLSSLKAAYYVCIKWISIVCNESKWAVMMRLGTLIVYLKEYSVILTTSFSDINKKILRKQGYFQNFS